MPRRYRVCPLPPSMEILLRPRLRNGRKFGETSQVVARHPRGRCDARHTAYVRFSGPLSIQQPPIYRAGAGAGVVLGAGLVLKSTFGTWRDASDAWKYASFALNPAKPAIRLLGNLSR